MELYRVILVDDEDEVRGRVISKISPDSGFAVVGKCSNGYDALELIEELKPHVVITDIKMPFIDGIELAKIIKRDYPTIKIAFLSGYDEFDFARQAIDLNVIAYLMKPVSTEDISEFLRKLYQTLESEKQMFENVESFRRKYSTSIPLIANSYLSGYTFRDRLNENDVNQLRQLGYLLNTNSYVTGLVSVFGVSEAHENDDFILFLRNLIEKVFYAYQEVLQFHTTEGVAFIISDNHIKSASDLDAKLFELKEYALKYHKMNLMIGVSEIFHDFTAFPTAFNQCIDAIQDSKFYNLGDIIYYKEFDELEKRNLIIPEDLIKEFIKNVKFWNESAVDQNIGQMKKILNEHKDNVVINKTYIVISLSNAILLLSDNVHVDINDIDKDLFNNLMAFSSIDRLFDYVKDIVKKLKESNVILEVNRAEKYVDDAMDYIRQNYHDSQISMDTCANALNISISYLSMLFKKIKKDTFNKYLVRTRMEKAIELLTSSHEKINTISNMVGYNEVFYFSHSFKKYTGLSPKEYRENGKQI